MHDLAEFFAVAVFVGVGDDDAVWYAVITGKPLTEQRPFVDVKDPIGYHSDLAIYSVPLLRIQANVKPSVSMQKKELHFLSIEGLVSSVVGEQASLVNVQHSVRKLVLSDAIVVDVRYTRYRSVYVAIHVFDAFVFNITQ